jgi:hypothetical protein
MIKYRNVRHSEAKSFGSSIGHLWQRASARFSHRDAGPQQVKDGWEEWPTDIYSLEQVDITPNMTTVLFENLWSAIIHNPTFKKASPIAKIEIAPDTHDDTHGLVHDPWYLAVNKVDVEEASANADQEHVSNTLYGFITNNKANYGITKTGEDGSEVISVTRTVGGIFHDEIIISPRRIVYTRLGGVIQQTEDSRFAIEKIREITEELKTPQEFHPT